MCGISGFYGSSNRELLTKMNDEMAHRGPDGHGIFMDDQVGLAHRRLTIIDTTKAGSQPMYSHDKRFVLIFNGEIYNYRELKIGRASSRERVCQYV